MASFLAMPDGKDRYQFAVISIERNVAAVSKPDEPLPELSRHLVGRPADLRMRGEIPHCSPNGLHRAMCGVTALRSEE